MSWLCNVISCILDLIRRWAGIELVQEYHPKKATMKARKVILTIEVLTDLPIAKLRKADGIGLYYTMSDEDVSTEALELVQIQANAVTDKPKKSKARR